ncbi:MAG: 6,7-dimethyl-8-ribityllumazine synthase [Flavobacteriales bacterium]|nr:6,7-dimethyl-8-ribityllumazine synthase [Flavobacteriales bacterium]
MASHHQNLSDHDPNKIPSAKGMKIALVVSEWNAEITEGLKKGALVTLLKYGAEESDLLLEYVPGSYELPLGAQFILESSKDIDAVICLGCVIQGETRHFDFVCEAVSQGVKDVGLKYNKPVIFGVLTDNTIEQSRARSGGKLGNKGDEAAVTAIKMVDLRKSLESRA